MLDLTGKTVAIVGGGPSLTDFPFASIEGRGWFIIAVNNAFRRLPSADMCFFADARWWRHNRDDLLAFKGQLVTSCMDKRAIDHERVVRLARDYKAPISRESTHLAGRDSGTMAVNLAYLMGASEIILFGFDMTFTEGRSHFHDEHIWPASQTRYEEQFAPRLAAMVEEIKRDGRDIWRATEPGIPNLEHRTL